MEVFTVQMKDSSDGGGELEGTGEVFTDGLNPISGCREQGGGCLKEILKGRRPCSVEVASKQRGDGR